MGYLLTTTPVPNPRGGRRSRGHGRYRTTVHRPDCRTLFKGRMGSRTNYRKSEDLSEFEHLPRLCKVCKPDDPRRIEEHHDDD